MLTNIKTIKGYKLNGKDESVGSFKEFFFDDKFWTIRYLVVTTGGLFSRKQVLISPYFVSMIDHKAGLINVNLTKDEIENSPSYDSEKPVSHQYEEEYYSYYNAPAYWGGPSMWGTSPSLVRDRDQWHGMRSQERSWNPDLRSSKDVSGHTIQATDDEIGHVDDFIFDDDNWAIRYMIVDTRNWLPGKKVLISPQWIDRISWDDSKVFVSLNRDTIKNAPEYDEDEVLTRDYETRLYHHYNRQGYWAEEPVTSRYGSDYSGPGVSGGGYSTGTGDYSRSVNTE